jgi:hypothetical protein
MKGRELGAIMGRHSLTVPDLALVMGVTNRSVFNWLSDNHQIPNSVSLLVKAFDQGIITVEWLANNLEASPEAEPPPKGTPAA